MPTDPSSGGGDDRAAEAPDDQLTFAVHDLGRERAPERPSRELGFTPVTAPVAVPSVPAPPAADGFVIRDAKGVAPAAPVDALVVGAPEPVAAAEPDGAAADQQRNAFRVNAATAAPAKAGELWTTRDPAPQPAAPAQPAGERRGWSTRHSEVVDRSAHATMLRLREEAVNVSWKSAWIAVTSCDPGMLRKRSR